jgi:hypothetical protein
LELLVAVKVRVDPEDAVNVPEPCPVHPVVQEIVRPPPVCVVTVRVVLPVTPLWLAVIVAVPVWFAVARPVLVILAIFAGEELQVAEEETSLLLPSPKLPVAVNCWVFVSCKDALEGETEIATRLLPEGKNFPQPAPMINARKIIAKKYCFLLSAEIVKCSLRETNFDMRCTAS